MDFLLALLVIGGCLSIQRLFIRGEAFDRHRYGGHSEPKSNVMT
jgi:hypothetical protein